VHSIILDAKVTVPWCFPLTPLFSLGLVIDGDQIPGNHILPAPNAYRSVFRKPDGSYDWEGELDYGWEMVDRASRGSLAAVIMEPILSVGGMLTLPSGYLSAMKAHCSRRGMLLILDEAQTAIGRAGDMFAFEHEGVAPDILTLSKTPGNGLPLNAVVTSTHIAEVAQQNGFLFLTTHFNDPLPAAVGLKVLEIVVRDNLVARSRAMGLKLHGGLQRLKDRYGRIGDVRGRGLLAAIEIVKDRESEAPAPELGDRLAAKMMALGLSANVSTIASFAGMFRIAPPVTVSEENLELGLGIMEEAFRCTEDSLPSY
jgi:4-aminobutyrate aminotransferase-like enzyme